jgi:hypothetical protein
MSEGPFVLLTATVAVLLASVAAFAYLRRQGRRVSVVRFVVAWGIFLGIAFVATFVPADLRPGVFLSLPIGLATAMWLWTRNRAVAQGSALVDRPAYWLAIALASSVLLVIAALAFDK